MNVLVANPIAASGIGSPAPGSAFNSWFIARAAAAFAGDATGDAISHSARFYCESFGQVLSFLRPRDVQDQRPDAASTSEDDAVRSPRRAASRADVSLTPRSCL